jgi:uncharacterized BrkB/YihY/UPF0761 family membrane protein
VTIHTHYQSLLPGTPSLAAVVTTVLFSIGEYLLGFYLARAAIVSAYGAARSLVVVLIWAYSSSLILFGGTRSLRCRPGRQSEEDLWDASR